jgi:hypothetical protein
VAWHFTKSKQAAAKNIKKKRNIIKSERQRNEMD